MGSDSLERFVTAQAPAYGDALSELQAGRKRGHWMWFVLPQLRGLGTSATAREYGIGSRAEARAYLAHPVLGPRLRECVGALQQHRGRPIEDILGGTDALKYRSCLTLFEAAAGPDPLFDQALAAFYRGERCPRTLAMLAEGGNAAV